MILLTGATGTSGVPIVNALLDRGEEVRVLARDPEKAVKLLGNDAEIARGDFNDPQTLEAAMEDVDRALLNSAPTPDLVKVQNTFIDVATRVGVKHVVKFSAIGARPGAPFRFGDWHGQVERYLERSGLAWTHLRPNIFMQNAFSLIGMLKAGTIYQPTGTGTCSFVDVRDIAAVAAATLTERGHEAQAYEITGPESLSYSAIAATFSRVLGRPIAFEDVSASLAKAGMIRAGLPDSVADAVNELSEQIKRGDFAPVSDVVQHLGKKTPITFEQFVRENVVTFA
jgi:uncharacterized protein YbjT (DUF2867 family)